MSEGPSSSTDSCVFSICHPPILFKLDLGNRAEPKNATSIIQGRQHEGEPLWYSDSAACGIGRNSYFTGTDQKTGSEFGKGLWDWDVYIAKRGKLSFTLARFSIILILISFFLCALSKVLILKPRPPKLAALQMVITTFPLSTKWFGFSYLTMSY